MVFLNEVKYEVGDEVFVIDNNKIKKGVIDRACYGYERYINGDEWDSIYTISFNIAPGIGLIYDKEFSEKDIYSSLQDLVENVEYIYDDYEQISHAK